MTSLDIDRLAEIRPFTPTMAAAMVSDDERDAVLRAIVSSGEARRPQLSDRRVRWSLAGIAVVGGFIAALVLALAGHAPSEQLPSTSYVLTATRHALADKRQGIVRISVTTPGSSLTVDWFDIANNDSRTDVYQGGRLQLTSYVVNARQVNLDYTTKTWSSTPPGSVVIGGFGLTRQGIERDLTNGTFRLAGSQTLAGVKALVLTGTSGGEIDRLWIDKSTYLPVRQTLSTKHGVNATMRYSWYPSTAKLRKIFVVTVPSGFTQVSTHPAASGATG